MPSAKINIGTLELARSVKTATDDQGAFIVTNLLPGRILRHAKSHVTQDRYTSKPSTPPFLRR